MRRKLILICTILWKIPIVLCARSGPFKAQFKRIEPCPNSSQPIDTNPYSQLFAELYNTSTEVNLMRGKVTVVKDHRIKKMKAKALMWDNGKWRTSYLMNNIGCNRIFFPVLVMATGVKYDPKSCLFYKGEYPFDNFNVNKIQHVWMTSQEYGRIVWRMEVFSQVGSVFCYEFETLIEPDK